MTVQVTNIDHYKCGGDPTDAAISHKSIKTDGKVVTVLMTLN